MDRRAGKIGHQLVERFIRENSGHHRPEVASGPAFGVDVAVVDLPGGQAMALTSDPLSLIPSLGLEESAWLSVHLMANDMATTGFAPQYGQFVLNMPAGFPKAEFERYWAFIHRFSAAIGLAITGGHTGFIEGQNSTIAGGGTLITVAPRASILTASLAQAGDTILVTKTCALSAAAILAKSFPQTVKMRAGTAHYLHACASFYETSSLPDALAAVGEHREHDDITAMHDVTEGGVLGAIHELATASRKGAVVDYHRLPIGDAQAAVCDVFALDPTRCIGAGSMIITCKPTATGEVISRLAGHGIACTAVGRVKPYASGLHVLRDNVLTEFIYQEEDPYWAAFFKAIQLGWK